MAISAAPPLKAIETKAYGCRFRSRLEARWAVAFTVAGIKWEYEPEGFALGVAGCYLPDFWLPQVEMWAEVKPGRPSDEEMCKAILLAQFTGKPCLLLIGQPAHSAYWAVSPQCHDYPGESFHWNGNDFCIDDYCPFEGDYHLTEHRFFSCCGVGSDAFPMPFDPGYGSHRAIEAARSARFEHGEVPA